MVHGCLRAGVCRARRGEDCRCGGRIACRVFADYLLQRMSKNLPWKDLDILLDVSRLGIREAHDGFEEIFAFGLGFGDSQWSEAFQVTSDAVFLLHGEADSNKGLQKEDSVNARDKAFFFLFPPNATDRDAVGRSIFWSDALEVGMNCAAILTPGELN